MALNGTSVKSGKLSAKTGTEPVLRQSSSKHQQGSAQAPPELYSQASASFCKLHRRSRMLHQASASSIGAPASFRKLEQASASSTSALASSSKLQRAPPKLPQASPSSIKLRQSSRKLHQASASSSRDTSGNLHEASTRGQPHIIKSPLKELRGVSCDATSAV